MVVDLLHILQLWLVCCKSQATIINQSKCQSLTCCPVRWQLAVSRLLQPSGLLFIYSITV